MNSSEEDVIKESIDLTREPTYSDYADSELVTSTGPSKKRSIKKKKVSRSKVDFKEELDDVIYEGLLDMPAASTGAMGLEMMDVIDAKDQIAPVVSRVPGTRG